METRLTELTKLQADIEALRSELSNALRDLSSELRDLRSDVRRLNDRFDDVDKNLQRISVALTPQ